MNEHVSSLYVRAHELLNLGMDGSPIYSDHFARLNREVYEQALDLYNTLEGLILPDNFPLSPCQ